MSHPQDNILTVTTLALLICLSAFTVDITLPILPEIADAFGLDSKWGAMTISAFMTGYALGQIPYGICADRFGRMPVVYIGLCLFILLGVLHAFVLSMPQLLLLRFLQGITGAVASVLSRAIVRDISSGSRTLQLMSILTIALGFSTLTAPIVGSYTAGAFGWRTTLVGTALLSLVLIVLFAVGGKETKPVHENTHTLWMQLANSIKAFLSQQQSIWAMCILSISFGGYLSIIVIAAPILQDIYGLDSTITGYFIGLSLLPYFFGAFYSHRNSVKIGAIRVLRLGIILYFLAGCLLVPIIILGTAQLVYFWPILLIYFFGIGIIMPSTTALILEPLPKSAGFASSITGTVQMGTSAALSWITASLYSGSIKDLAMILGIVSFIVAGLYALKGHIDLFQTETV